MEDGRFWAIVDEARGAEAGPKTPSADPERLKAILSAMPDEDVAAFGLRFYAEVARLNRTAVWAAGYVIDGGMSDDSYHYFRSWIIGKGKTAVEQALTDPDGLVDYINDPDNVDNELLEYVAVEILEARGLDDPRNAFVGDLHPDDEPEGGPFDEDTVGEKYPRLAAAFGFSD